MRDSTGSIVSVDNNVSKSLVYVTCVLNCPWILSHKKVEHAWPPPPNETLKGDCYITVVVEKKKGIGIYIAYVYSYTSRKGS